MMRLSLAVVLFILAVDNAFSTSICVAKRGKRLISFSRTAEEIKFPCKYNAVRNTICGKWKVTVSPGNALDPERNKKYIVKTLWVTAENLVTQEEWSGRSNLKIARKYLAGIAAAPFNQRAGNVQTSDVFRYGDVNDDNKVSLTEKSNQFKITFGLYEPFGAWHRSSGFKFECFANRFEPTNYPTQLCGNGTRREVRSVKKTLDGKDSRLAALVYNVFSNDDIIQTDPDCKAAAESMQNECTTPESRYNAAKVCWPISGKPKFQRCFTSHGDNPITIFKDCVEYMCTGSQSSCLALGPKLDMCPKLGVVSPLVKQQCYPTLYSN